MSQLVSLQGKIYLAERGADGRPINPVWVGNAPTCTLALTSETTTKTESFTGNRLPYGRLNRAKTATLNLVLDEWSRDNLALGLYAKVFDTVAGAVTDEVVPEDIAEGDVIQLDHRFISNLAITDNTTEPVPHEIESSSGGLVVIGDLTGLASPYKAAYSYAAKESYSIFATNAPERFLILDGINTEDGSRAYMELYRCSFDPISDLGLIHEEYGQLTMTGSTLYDPLNVNNSNLHGFGELSRPASLAP